MTDDIFATKPDAAGTADDPILCWRMAYRTCHHAVLTPAPKPGQHYRVTGYLDADGRCPACEEARPKRGALTEDGKKSGKIASLNAEITNRQNGSEFLGCSHYPQCTHTEPITEYLKLRAQGAEPLF